MWPPLREALTDAAWLHALLQPQPLQGLGAGVNPGDEGLRLAVEEVRETGEAGAEASSSPGGPSYPPRQRAARAAAAAASQRRFRASRVAAAAANIGWWWRSAEGGP